MSQAGFGFGDVDLDRLADYIAGALDRTQAAQVATLIADEPAWAQAHEALVEADALVQAQLRADAAATADSMPADVVARLEAALGAPPANVIAFERSGSHAERRGEARRRAGRGTRRTLVGVAAAVVASVAVIVGVNVAGGLSIPQGSTAARDAGAPAVQGGNAESGAENPAVPPLAVGAVRIVASGTDYGPGTLRDLGRFGAVAGPTLAPSAATPPTTNNAVPDKTVDQQVPSSVSGKVTGTLARLTQSTALEACLSAVLSAHPGEVTAMDFARYLSAPALLVLIRQAGGTALAVAVGPDCGLGGQTDEKAAVPI